MKKSVLQFITFLIIPIILCHIFTWFYEKPERETLKSGANIYLQKWNSIKNNSQEYDLIILGSSRGGDAYNPGIIDSTMNLNPYNMCTNSQHIIESYYMFKEILKYQKPKYLVYEVTLTNFSSNPDMYYLYSNSKFMSSGMIRNEFVGNKITDYLFPIIKYMPFLKQSIHHPASYKKDDVQLFNGYHPLMQKNDSIAISNFAPLGSFSNTGVSKKDIEKYFKALKKLCDSNGVKLICMRAPYPPSRIKVSAADDVYPYFNDFFNSQEIPFFDLNYVSEKVYTDFDFRDFHHMNTFGAKKATIELTEILNDKISDSF